MLEAKYTILRNLPLSELANPEYLDILHEFAGELAPACIAEALMQWIQCADGEEKTQHEKT